MGGISSQMAPRPLAPMATNAQAAASFQHQAPQTLQNNNNNLNPGISMIRSMQPQQQQMNQAQYQNQHQQQQQMNHQQLQQRAVPTGGGGQPTQAPRPKVILNENAKTALSKAIWSAIRSPEGKIDKALMDAALATGLPRDAILKAAKVARERDAEKRRQKQQQLAAMAAATQQQQQQQTLAPAPTNMRPSLSPANVPQASSSIAAMAPAAPKGPSKSEIQAAQQKALQAAQQKALLQKQQEREKWNRVQAGVFALNKGKFAALPFSVSGIVRAPKAEDAPGLGRKRPLPSSYLDIARSLQAQVRNQGLRNLAKRTSEVTLLDPEKYKRVKLEPKKHSRALDRLIKKTRQTVSDQLSKQHKEFARHIASHQTEFLKFHRNAKVEAGKVARAIRDAADKNQKRKEKDTLAAERARMAALKANDMDAYSKLLEDTKNERLQFLMDKTERHFSQISTSLLQERNKDGSVQSAGGGTSSYYASAHLKQEEVRQPSILVGGDLKEYQMAGLQWMVSLYNNKLNGILADEVSPQGFLLFLSRSSIQTSSLTFHLWFLLLQMGLGKTIQAISLVAYLMEIKGNLGPYLVIVPLSTLSNWTNEFAKWCPSAHVVCYKGTPVQRRELYKDQVRNGHFNVLLTTYEYIIKDKASLRKIEWQYAIVDEGHRMKNAASKFARTLSTKYITKFRLLLTGTPLMNDLSELWSLLNFLLPSIFNSVDTFDQWFNQPFSTFGSQGTAGEEEDNMLTNEERMFIIHRLHELLRPFMLRRVKSEVLDQLPEKVEKILRCDLSSWQKELYKQISKKVVEENNLLADNSLQQSQPAQRGLNNVVMQLRKVCNHPYLFAQQGYQIDEEIIRSSGKIALLDNMLPKLRAGGHRVLLFTQMTQVITILEDYFAYRGYLSLRLDGSTTAEEREKRMYKFNAPDSPYFVFLLSTRAGGLGLNLTAADTVIIFDSDWNPMMDLQAQDRAHRIGQRSDVSVFRLISNSPVEEKILSRASEKLNMSELVVDAGQFDKRSVENDNSLERKKMMEVLLTDFSNRDAVKAEDTKTDITGSDVGDDDDDDDDGSDGGSDAKENELNELFSNNDLDYELYQKIDAQRAADGGEVDASLYTSDADIPDWILYPQGKQEATEVHDPMADLSRKRKEVRYDDGLTEKQFVRLMDKQIRAEEAAKEAAKGHRKGGGPVATTSSAATESEISDWTYRKIIAISKQVVALKDPATKRRLSDLFLEKPSPEQFPDYYEIIEQPIAINDILRKCRNKLYKTMQEYRDDWKLMFANARQFNGEGSWVDEDAKTLGKELERILKKNGFAEEVPKQQKAAPKRKKKEPTLEPATAATESEPAEDGKEATAKPKKKKLRLKISLKKAS